VVFSAARIVPAGRQPGWIGELAAATLAALAFGALATALDFGGWQEIEWHAAVLAGLGALAAVGSFRLIRLLRTR
jgi:hypothetical protein